jgi:hypothetical protein
VLIDPEHVARHRQKVIGYEKDVDYYFDSYSHFNIH